MHRRHAYGEGASRESCVVFRVRMVGLVRGAGFVECSKCPPKFPRGPNAINIHSQISFVPPLLAVPFIVILGPEGHQRRGRRQWRDGQRRRGHRRPNHRRYWHRRQWPRWRDRRPVQFGDNDSAAWHFDGGLTSIQLDGVVLCLHLVDRRPGVLVLQFGEWPRIVMRVGRGVPSSSLSIKDESKSQHSQDTPSRRPDSDANDGSGAQPVRPVRLPCGEWRRCGGRLCEAFGRCRRRGSIGVGGFPGIGRVQCPTLRLHVGRAFALWDGVRRCLSLAILTGLQTDESRHRSSVGGQARGCTIGALTGVLERVLPSRSTSCFASLHRRQGARVCARATDMVARIVIGTPIAAEQTTAGHLLITP